MIGKHYEGVARTFLQLGEHAETASRYLGLVRRERILRSGLKQAHREAADESGLGGIPFTLPLNVHGCPSITVVKAEELSLKGFPVTFVRGAGTHIDDVVQMLRESGDETNHDDVLSMFRDYCLGTEKLIHLNAQGRYSRLPTLLAKVRTEIEKVQSQLSSHIDDVCGTRFSATVLAEGLRGLTDSIDDEIVILGCRKQRILVRDYYLTAATTRGSGLASIRIADLANAANTTDQYVMLSFGLSSWEATAFTTEPNGRTTKYDYA